LEINGKVVKFRMDFDAKVIKFKSYLAPGGGGGGSGRQIFVLNSWSYRQSRTNRSARSWSIDASAMHGGGGGGGVNLGVICWTK